MDNEDKRRDGLLISFRVDPAIATAMATVARKEFLTKTGIARRALADDLRRRGLLEDVA